MMEPTYSEVTESLYDRLPEVYQESDKMQDYPVSIPALPAATNLVTNPSFETDTVGWTAYAGTNGVATLSRPAGGVAGSAHLRMTWTTASLGRGAPYIDVPITPGTVLNASAYVRTNSGRSIYVGIEFLSSTNTTLAVDSGPVVSPNTAWTRAFYQANPAPAGTVTARVLIWLDNAANVGDWLDVDAVQVTATTSALDYFDGDTSRDGYGSLWSWTGTPHQSTSVQRADPGQLPGYPLKRYISSVTDTLGEVRTLYDRFDYEAADGDMSDLVYAPEADDAWLDYIAQVLGVGSLRGMTVPQKRTILVDPSIGYRAGTPESIIAAASTVVSGSGYVGLYKFSTDTSAIGAATMWDILLVTRSGEAAPGDVVNAVKNLGVKPAGVKLYWREWQVTWTAIHTNYPTWASINALPNWAALEKTGI